MTKLAIVFFNPIMHGQHDKNYYGKKYHQYADAVMLKNPLSLHQAVIYRNLLQAEQILLLFAVDLKAHLSPRITGGKIYHVPSGSIDMISPEHILAVINHIIIQKDAH